MGVNSVHIVGRLGKDPDMKMVAGDQTVCKLVVATDEQWLSKDGSKQSRTEWHNIVFWGKTAQIAGKYLVKGKEVYVSGKLQTRSWEGKDGNKKYTTEIIGNQLQMIGPKMEAKEAKPHDNFGDLPSFDQHEEVPF